MDWPNPHASVRRDGLAHALDDAGGGRLARAPGDGRSTRLALQMGKGIGR